MGGKNRAENSLLLLNDVVFDAKNIDNIISGPQRTVQYKKTKAVCDPFN